MILGISPTQGREAAIQAQVWDQPNMSISVLVALLFLPEMATYQETPRGETERLAHWQLVCVLSATRQISIASQASPSISP